jgi:hypothetical protein
MEGSDMAGPSYSTLLTRRCFAALLASVFPALASRGTWRYYPHCVVNEGTPRAGLVLHLEGVPDSDITAVVSVWDARLIAIERTVQPDQGVAYVPMPDDPMARLLDYQKPRRPRIAAISLRAATWTAAADEPRAGREYLIR